MDICAKPKFETESLDIINNNMLKEDIELKRFINL